MHLSNIFKYRTRTNFWGMYIPQMTKIKFKDFIYNMVVSKFEDLIFVDKKST